MLGSATAPVRPGARAGAPVHVAFRSMHSVGVAGVVLSRLDGQPVRAPVNASPAPSRVPPHGLVTSDGLLTARARRSQST